MEYHSLQIAHYRIVLSFKYCNVKNKTSPTTTNGTFLSPVSNCPSACPLQEQIDLFHIVYCNTKANRTIKPYNESNFIIIFIFTMLVNSLSEDLLCWLMLFEPSVYCLALLNTGLLCNSPIRFVRSYWAGSSVKFWGVMRLHTLGAMGLEQFNAHRICNMPWLGVS